MLELMTSHRRWGDFQLEPEELDAAWAELDPLTGPAAGERTVKRGPSPFVEPLVEGSSVPSQKRTENGRSGSAFLSSLRSGAVLANATLRS